MAGLERLQKILSAAGVASRRAAERLLIDGRVTVNGVVVRTPGSKADAATDDIRVDGRRVRVGGRRRYLLLNKPAGYVTTRADPAGRPTVMDLVQVPRGAVYPVGRLDYDSEGLLLLTNDGELAARLTHPRHGIERTYEVTVERIPEPAVLERLAGGVLLDGRRTRPATVRLLRGGRQPVARLAVSIKEGRNRQVRRMCEAVGHRVIRLRRTRFGPIEDARLKPGEARDLTPTEVAALRRAVGLEASG